MFAARRQFLAYEAAFLEASPVQLLEAAFQEERLLRDEVAAAVGDTQSEAMTVVDLGLGWLQLETASEFRRSRAPAR